MKTRAKNPTAYERQRISEAYLRRDASHWQQPSSRGNISGRFRPPQSVEQRAHALVAELLSASDASGRDFSPEDYDEGSYQRLLLLGEGNGNGVREHRNHPHPSYYQSEGSDHATWYAEEDTRARFPSSRHEFHSESTPRLHKRGRGVEESQYESPPIYEARSGGGSKPSSRPPSLKSSPVGKASRHYPTQLQHALASIQRAKSQKVSPGKLATEQASRVKRKYTRRDQPPVKIADESIVARVQKARREDGGSPMHLRDEMHSQPKRLRPSLSIHIPKTSGSNPTSPQGVASFRAPTTNSEPAFVVFARCRKPL